MTEPTIAAAPSAEQPATGFPPGVAYVDGRFCDISQARISVLDWGFLRSDATYDVAHVWKGRFFRLDKHLDRFIRSVHKLRMRLPIDRDGLCDVLMECVRRSALREAYVEMICTRGHSPGYSRDPRDAVNNFLAFAIPFSWVADEEQRARGLHIAVSRVRRIPPASVDPTVKNYHWLDLVAGLFEAYDRGAESVALTDLSGNLSEGPGFNLFVVKDGAAVTPDRGVLEGITRRTAIELCAELGIPVAAAPLPVERLAEADEVFITSTAGGIMPVTRIDGRPVGDGRPGPITGRLTALYWEKHEDPAWTTPVVYVE
ncbi:MAG: aminotransferase class IV [Kiloniellaceae bacterium]